jgi:pyruvate dehydrogenase E2 component (dihydrolipoamide acetyltransferase)
MPHVELHHPPVQSMWRRMAVALWGPPADPQIYARLEIDMGRALDYAKRLSRAAGVTVRPVHLVARALALCLREHADANAIVRGHSVYRRQKTHIFFQVAIPGKNPDLSGAVIRDADTKPPGEIAKELRAKVRDVLRGTDQEMQQARRAVHACPRLFYGALLRLVTFVQYILNCRLTRFGFPEDPFGSAMVTDVGSLGVSEAFAPLVPLTRTPLVVSVGKIEERPAVRDGQVVARPLCTLGVTLDHRVFDGLLAARLAKSLALYLEDPEDCEEARKGEGEIGRAEGPTIRPALGNALGNE